MAGKILNSGAASPWVAFGAMPEAAGYHWHPPLNLERCLSWFAKARAGKDGIGVLPATHPPGALHHSIHHLASPALGAAHLGWLLNERLRLLAWLIRRGHPGVAMEVLRLPLNRIALWPCSVKLRPLESLNPGQDTADGLGRPFNTAHPHVSGEDIGRFGPSSLAGGGQPETPTTWRLSRSPK